MKNILILLVILGPFICCYSQTPYPLIIEGNTNYTQSHVFPGPIISPSVSTSPLEVHGTNQVVWESDNSITLKDGFTASSFTGSGYFQAKINSLPIRVVLIDPVPSNTEEIVHIHKWEKLEIGIELPQEYTTAIENFFNHYYYNPPVVPSTDLNPYADDSLKLELHLTSPSNTSITKYGFFCRMAEWNSEPQPFLVEGTNDPLYPYKIRFRFAPDEANTTVPWSFYFTINAPNTTGLSTIQYDLFQFICDPPLSDNKGFLGLNANNTRYLQFDPPNGPGFFGIGSNMADNRGVSNPYTNLTYTPYYDDYLNYMNTLDEMESRGANYVRTFMLNSNFAFEWDNLGVYDNKAGEPFCEGGSYGQEDPEYLGNRQYNAWMLDKVFEKLRENDIYLQLCIDPYPAIGAYQRYIWGNQAYIKYLDNYGPCNRNNTLALFTDSDLRRYWKRKYKYIMARWGYSVNLAVLETFNEINQTLGYHEKDLSNPTDFQLCGPVPCEYRLNYPESLAVPLRTAIGQWHDDIVGYVKDPVSSNGLGEGHRLFTVSYADYDGTNPQSYHFLYDHPKIDLVDFHKANYNATPNINDDFYNTYNRQVAVIFPYNHKPMHQGESSVPGPDALSVADQYNNYDVSFHNTLWATAFMGGFTTGLEWSWWLIHRWPNMNPQSIGQTISNLSSASCGSTIPAFTINSYYYNYQRLSEFMSHVDFDSDLIPKEYILYNNIPNIPPYNNGIDDDNGVECFYLQDSNTNPDKTYGWVHNANKYWYKTYYSDNNGENYCGCTPPNYPYNTYVFIPGFAPNTNYDVTFYQTQISQTLPAPYTFTSSSTGDVMLDFGFVPLDCDPAHADYAFIIDNPNLNRLQTHSNFEFDFNLFPNPASDRFTLSLVHSTIDAEQKELTVRDVVGQLIYKETLSGKANSVTIDFSDKPKGMYFVTVKGAETEKTKKLIIH